ncbi:MAG: hypothetical protein KGH60_02385, partial [Candidatus Micrarchaeota archaeon]|nr:hypothetical protein [Candidatus Micrarchaeota archaeon]
KAPIPVELDWLPFNILLEEYKANGNQYPFYSKTAQSLNGHEDLSVEITQNEWNASRKTIFAEAVEEINHLNNKAAQDKEFIEGLKKRIWESNKANYSKLLNMIS